MSVYGPGTDPNEYTTSRDTCADAGRGGDQYEGRYDYKGMPFVAQSLQEEADQEGWTRITRPTGGRAPEAMTAGTRGAVDEAVGDKDSPAAGYELPGDQPRR